jgi:hypothetical protein
MLTSRLTSRLKAISFAVASIALTSTALATSAQAQYGSFHPGYERPSINEPGPLCQTKLVRVCTTSNGQTHCKPTWQTICREVQTR